MRLIVSPKVDDRGLRLRIQPGVTSGIITVLQTGEALETLDSDHLVQVRLGVKDQWLLVKDSSGKIGYCAAWMLERPAGADPSPIPDQTNWKVKVSDRIGSNRLRLRPEPSNRSTTLAGLSSGVVLTVLEPRQPGLTRIGVDGHWLHVQDPQGHQGYVSTLFLEEYQHPASQPEPDLPSNHDPELIPILPDPSPQKVEPGSSAGSELQPVVQPPSPPQADQPPRAEPPPKPLVVKVVNSVGSRGLRLRSAPNLAGAVLEVMPAGTLLEVLDPTREALARVGVFNQWLSVKDNSGRQGYTAAWFVEPVTPPPAASSSKNTPSHEQEPVSHLYYDVPILSQDNLYGNAACSPVSACMLLEYYHQLSSLNRTVTPQQLIAMLDPGDGIPGKGMSLSNVTDELQSLGYLHISQKLYARLEDLKAELLFGPLVVTVGVKLAGAGTLTSSQGRAILGPGETSHAMVVKGFTSDQVIVNDPWSGKEYHLPNDIFERMWKLGLNGLYIIRP